MTDFTSTSTPTRTLSLSDQSDQTETLQPLDPAPEPETASVGQPAPRPVPRLTTTAAQRTALVVLVAIAALAVAFIVMLLVGVSSESINALAVFATPIASMVAAYYGITLSIQQVRSERAEKEKAIARADAADAASRETEVWASQMESGLRVAMAQLTAARIGTDSVTKAAGTPDDFF
ncbi:hypothetical protein [Cryobacterium cryoconiti]|uniref:Uncharacterized protein n=1 Tax=Cryobacterium cryoconiti TaxID=1259239 RepID=A0A4Y8JXZ3_9MICO|nr:hypothetical protein [Cryobacterium cryoconiti]TFD31455.1 hypothetical protein E3T49_06125 [Cryobacterium cryoconiti]